MSPTVQPDHEVTTVGATSDPAVGCVPLKLDQLGFLTKLCESRALKARIVVMIPEPVEPLAKSAPLCRLSPGFS